MTKKYQLSDWLPTTKKELEYKQWDYLDVIIFTGDAYVDHPSFGAAVIGRILENSGYKVAIVPQPNWQDDLRDFKKLGIPRLFFAVTSGAMDSMMNHYTAALRKRADDAYTAGGETGKRPDYATLVYSKILKNLYPEVPVVIGGVEASLRRFTHYDYWSNTLKQSILVESGADVLVYGMGEQAVKQLAKYYSNPQKTLLESLPQIAYIERAKSKLNIESDNTKLLSSYELCVKDKKKFATNFTIIETESNSRKPARLIEPVKNCFVVVNPPFENVNPDEGFDLPYTRMPHPKYKSEIPAYTMIRHSLNIHRGCFGGCSFCTISAHQGKFILSRSEKSILREVDEIVQMPDFAGHISDVGGPSANMYQMQGKDLNICNSCKRYSCIYPSKCKNLHVNHEALVHLYRKIRQTQGIRKVSIGSGVRYDLVFMDNDKNANEYLRELIIHHVSGRLKVAPEHTEASVLQIMRKPAYKDFEKLYQIFHSLNNKHQLNQQLVPYFISGHPGCKNVDMAELLLKVNKMNLVIEQVQDFTPTPMTLASVMYYCGFDPYTGKQLHVAKSTEEKNGQKKYFFWYKKEFREKIIRELEKLGRKDLIQKIFNKRVD